MRRFRGYMPKTTDSSAGGPSGTPVAASYGRSGSLSWGLRNRQLALQTGPVLNASSEDERQAA